MSLSGDEAPDGPRRLRRIRRMVLMAACAIAAFGLLGQGEDMRVDPRFISPGATLATYWLALRSNDAATVEDCFLAGSAEAPFPGMLWFLPQSAELRLDSFRSLPVTSGRVMVSYEVHYLVPGDSAEESFQTGSELLRERGEWRIIRALGEASMPEWRPVQRPVDI